VITSKTKPKKKNLGPSPQPTSKHIQSKPPHWNFPEIFLAKEPQQKKEKKKNCNKRLLSLSFSFSLSLVCAVVTKKQQKSQKTKNNTPEQKRNNLSR
jgi:hypothetical protein